VRLGSPETPQPVEGLLQRDLDGDDSRECARSGTRQVHEHAALGGVRPANASACSNSMAAVSNT
jgi:hypothetical protein